MSHSERQTPTKVLVLGASGLLGHAVLGELARASSLQAVGTIRTEAQRSLFPESLARRLVVMPNVESDEMLARLFAAERPQVVVNCVALGKEELAQAVPLRVFAMFSALPRRLSQLCARAGARFIQISSDGVFSGTRGGYTEEAIPDATDLYGVAKYLGEVDAPHAVTLRTSMIGHELAGKTGLLEWFLAQEGQCRCYTRAIFSGLPAVVIGELIRDQIIPRPDMSGIYHLAADPISKYDLLGLVAAAYGKTITILPDDKIVIDRSLSADKFRRITGYKPPSWKQLIQTMYTKNRGDADV